MPILAPFPVVDHPLLKLAGLPDPDFADSRGFGFRSIDGESFLGFTGDEFIARWGIQGLDVPARTVVEESIPYQDGTDLSDIKVGSRTYSIPLFVGSNSGHLAYLRNRATMRSFFNHRSIDYRGASGTFDLVATSALGERTLRSVYVDGMNGQWDQETAGSYWETFGLTALAVNPYWNGGRWSSELIRTPDVTASWFGAFPPRLAPANLLNAASSIYVDGDSGSWPQVDAVGPCTALSVVGTDLLIDIPDGLDDGEVLMLDSDPRSKRVLFDGVSDWSRLSPLSVLAPLLPGAQELTISMDNPQPNSYVQVSGTQWWETPW